MDWHRAALDAWHAETPDGPASEVDWDSHKDCWLDGWETGYRAALLQHSDGRDDVADGA